MFYTMPHSDHQYGPLGSRWLEPLIKGLAWTTQVPSSIQGDFLLGIYYFSLGQQRKVKKSLYDWKSYTVIRGWCVEGINVQRSSDPIIVVSSWPLLRLDLDISCTQYRGITYPVEGDRDPGISVRTMRNAMPLTTVSSEVQLSSVRYTKTVWELWY